MTWGCQAGVESAKLTAVIHHKTNKNESRESVKLGIDFNAKLC